MRLRQASARQQTGVLPPPVEDGTTAVVLEPQVLMERLWALVPRPRRNLVTYHGVLAPAAGMRDYPWLNWR